MPWNCKKNYNYGHVNNCPCPRATKVGRESSHGREELLNLPDLVLKARHLSGSALVFYRWARLGTGMASPWLGLVLELMNFHVV